MRPTLGYIIRTRSYFLDKLNALRRISSHMTSVGYAFQRKQKKSGQSRNQSGL